MARSVRIAETPPRFSLQVHTVELLADEIYRVRLDPHPLPWEPGDCVTIHAPDADEGRPYSFSGPPNAPYSEFWIRKFPEGRVSNFLTNLERGEAVEVSPPFGWFRPGVSDQSPKIFIATGTGIAPFLSALSVKECSPEVVLWGMRHPLPVPGVLASQSLICACSRERSTGAVQGRVTDHIDALDLSQNPHIYLCGLDEMIKEVSELLRARGVSDSRIHSECFFTSSAFSS